MTMNSTTTAAATRNPLRRPRVDSSSENAAPLSSAVQSKSSSSSSSPKKSKKASQNENTSARRSTTSRPIAGRRSLGVVCLNAPRPIAASPGQNSDVSKAPLKPSPTRTTEVLDSRANKENIPPHRLASISVFSPSRSRTTTSLIMPAISAPLPTSAVAASKASSSTRFPSSIARRKTFDAATADSSTDEDDSDSDSDSDADSCRHRLPITPSPSKKRCLFRSDSDDKFGVKMLNFGELSPCGSTASSCSSSSSSDDSDTFSTCSSDSESSVGESVRGCDDDDVFGGGSTAAKVNEIVDVVRAPSPTATL